MCLSILVVDEPDVAEHFGSGFVVRPVRARMSALCRVGG